ncbi:hypothetical protein [Pseudomaricurvus sp. HS19]|uniref:hypothetical protein n=1 Tax=Pseudomaricurvus sp. HS19 TaxID=2692626 RepID=UPI00136CC678|nr:hypothetical protein [Pseudomaricurvus sp. HS19]MYM61985.1 hypothetical protein [Pseudomaricurvus sp. HS19]
MKTSTPGHNMDNVVDFFTGRPLSEAHNSRIIRLSPELDGLEMLYSNEASPDSLFSLKILCWALRANGEVVGMVPWLNSIMPATEIQDPLNGKWEGYFDPGIDEIFYEAPIHKIVELETAAEYYDYTCDNDNDVIQEIPDTIGTHAVLSDNGFHSITLTEVVSWRLHHDGNLCGMLADPAKIKCTPILPGDDCLYPAQSRSEFRYFFQHQIANKIKSEDPEALAAISALVEDV